MRRSLRQGGNAPAFRYIAKANFSTGHKTRKVVDELLLSKAAQSQPTLLQKELADVIRPYYDRQEPLVVRGAVKEVPATKLWSSNKYWRNLSEDPLVAVELGGAYGSQDSERAEIPFSAYLQFLELFEERHGSKGSLQDDIEGSSTPIPSEELVYMAQNDVFQEITTDILIPGFCERQDTATTIGLGRLYSIMMWLGPRGCVSPLHFDPLDNIFMQHKGRKRFLLFEPSKSVPWHYAGHEGQQSNTSPINPEVLDWSETKGLCRRYPMFFKEAPQRLECLLEPGDLLYIPSKWWHHVRSIDASASVNVWWR